MDAIQKNYKMGRALVGVNLLSEPLFTLYAFLVFILYKDLGATAFQVSLLAMLKPFVTILSFYWSAGLEGKASKLKSNVLWAGFFMRAPFILCLWISSPWYLIFAAANYMLFYRAAMPAWLEILRRNLDKEKRSTLFSMSSAIGYIEGVFLALGCGALLDQNPSCWKALFLGASLIGLLALFVQSRITVQGADIPSKRPSLKEVLIRPWRDSYRLMRDRPDFSRFQWGFMVSGFGLMLMQPAIPLFMVDTLKVSYLEITSAICIAKGLGFALSSPIWGRWIDKLHLFKMASFVFIAIGLFALLLSFSLFSLSWLFIAYFWYGVGQGGSHLVWNMSGPIFSGNEESSRYTGVNVAMAGIRGMLAPPLGGLLSVFLGPLYVLGIGGSLCLYSGARLLKSKFAKDSLLIKS